MNLVAAEVRQAFRTLLAQPTWTLASLLCLAIGTGANTATFSLINGLLLRPLPFDEPRQIVMMAVRWSTNQQPGPVSLEDHRQLQAAGLPFEHLAVRTFLPVGVSSGAPARMVQAEFASGGYFNLLRIRPLAGRFLSEEADHPGIPVEGVLSERLWRSHFNSDTSIVGRSIRVNGKPVLVVGVAPAGFVGAMRLIAADLWMPAAAFGTFASPSSPREAEARRVFGVVGRLQPGMSLTRTQDQVSATLANHWRLRDHAGEAPPVSLIEEAAGFGVPPGARPLVLRGSALLFALMAMLVAIAVANVAGLMLARATARQKETAVKLTLGASRVHIIRPVLIESLVLTTIGASLGALLAVLLPSVFHALSPNLPEHLTFAIDIRPDWRTGIYSLLTAIVVAGLFGLAPARQAASTDSGLALRDSGGNSRTKATSRTLNAFVTCQVALSTVLLVLTLLLGRTYLNTQSVNPGIDIRNTLAISLDWDQAGSDEGKGRLFFERLQERVSALPAVQSLAFTRHPPLSPGGNTVTVSAGSLRLTAGTTVVTAGYFDTVRLPLLQGRHFHSADTGGRLVAIINETMAKQLAAGSSPVGTVFTAGGRSLEVIGVVKDAKYRSLSEAPRPVFYEPLTQTYSPQMTLLVRSGSDPRSLIQMVRREISAENSDLATIAIRTLEDQFSESAAPSRQRAAVIGGACALALVLSSAGLFGVMSYGVRLRVRELGIRAAIGARPADIAFIVLRQAIRLVAAGGVLGVLLALGAARLVSSALFGASPTEPLMLLMVISLLAVVALAAALLPARWAMRVDPVRCIRAE